MHERTDALRAEIARGWARSGLSQTAYAAQHGVSPRTLRGWISRYAARQPPADQVRAIVTDAIAKLQAILDSLDVPSGKTDGDEDVGPHGVPDPTSSGMPGGNKDVPEIKEPGQPVPIGPACPAAPPPPPSPGPVPPRRAPPVDPRTFSWGF